MKVAGPMQPGVDAMPLLGEDRLQLVERLLQRMRDG